MPRRRERWMRGAANITKTELKEVTDIALSMSGTSMGNIKALFDSNNLEEVEQGIKWLNELSGSAWLLSAILLYVKIFTGSLFEQSGDNWVSYVKAARKRLNMEARDITDKISSARFFIMYGKRLIERGWSPIGNLHKLSRAELATELCGDVEQTLDHLLTDSWQQFKAWYYALKPALPKSRHRKDIDASKLEIKGVKVVQFADTLSKHDRRLLESCIRRALVLMRNGQEVIITTRDATP